MDSLIIIIGIIEAVILLLIILFFLFFAHKFIMKKSVKKRLHVLYELSKKFYTQKNIVIVASDLLRLFVDSTRVFRCAGFYLLDSEGKVKRVHIFDRIYGFQEGVQISDSLADKVSSIKHYVNFSSDEVRLNNYVSYLPLIKYKYLHFIKFTTGTDVHGAFFFGTNLAKIDDFDYEYLRTVIDHFSLGAKSKRLVKQVDSFTKTITLLEHTYQQIVDHLPLGVVVVDSKNKITYWNNLMEHMFEKKETEVIGNPIDSIILRKSNKKRILELIKQSQEEKDIQEIEFLRLFDSSGDRKVFLVLCYPLHESDFDIQGTMIVFRDITERFELENKLKKIQESKSKELEDKIQVATKELVDANIELRKMNNLKTEFVSVVSHELRTPLTSIRGYISLMLTERLGKLSSKQKEGLSIVKIESERLSNLINDLLDLSRLESGKTVLDIKKVSIDTHLHDTIASLKLQAKPKGIKISFNASSKPSVHCDIEKIKQVLYNIIGNAIKFTPDKGLIKVSLTQNKNHVLISVSDTGIGIPKDKLDNLFEPFFQIEGHLKRSVPGTGLGLTISKHIIELHHGKIIVESQLNKGSTFTIVLPKHSLS